MLPFAAKLLKQSIHLFVTHSGDCPEHIRSFADSLADRFGHLFSKQEKLVFVGFKFNGELVDQLLGRAVPFFELVVLDFRDVGKPDAYTVG